MSFKEYLDKLNEDNPSSIKPSAEGISVQLDVAVMGATVEELEEVRKELIKIILEGYEKLHPDKQKWIYRVFYKK